MQCHLCYCKGDTESFENLKEEPLFILGEGMGTWKAFPQDVIFRLKCVNRKLRRRREDAVCVKPARARAKALWQGRAW